MLPSFVLFQSPFRGIGVDTLVAVELPLGKSLLCASFFVLFQSPFRSFAIVALVADELLPSFVLFHSPFRSIGVLALVTVELLLGEGEGSRAPWSRHPQELG